MSKKWLLCVKIEEALRWADWQILSDGRMFL